MQNYEIKTKKDSFSQQLINLILSGQLKPGDRLPPERVLAGKYGISRGSVNQAILDMERMGFLRIVPRKGTFVSEYMANATPDTLAAVMSYDSDMVDSSLFNDLMQLRILVERESVQLACRRVNSSFVAGLSERTGAIFSDGNDLTDAIYEFHRYIVQNSGNAAYMMVFRSFERMLRSMIQLHYKDRREVQKNMNYYAAIAAAVSQGDGKEASVLMGQLLSGSSQYIDAVLREREVEHGM